MTTGEKIKKFRKDKGLTQKKLGELCSIDEANIRKYELGKANPKIETLSKIANALNIPVNYLLDSINIDLMSEYDTDGLELVASTNFGINEAIQSILFENDCRIFFLYGGYIIQKKSGKRIKISKSEYCELEKDINFFVKYLLEKLFNSHDCYFNNQNVTEGTKEHDENITNDENF